MHIHMMKRINYVQWYKQTVNTVEQMEHELVTNRLIQISIQLLIYSIHILANCHGTGKL